jgi:Suppressor of fused protein (SUFU)
MRMSELLRHIERHLGPRTRTVEASSYAIGVHTRPDMVTAVTDGMRRHSLQSALPLELACSARPGQEDAAVRLVELFADTNLRDGTEVEYDDGLLAEEPLLPSTSVQGLLAAPHPHADEMFNLFRTASGELSLQFVTLVPVTAAEGRHLRDHETTELFELWRSAGTDLLDLHRASAV